MFDQMWAQGHVKESATFALVKGWDSAGEVPYNLNSSGWFAGLSHNPELWAFTYLPDDKRVAKVNSVAHANAFAS